MKSSQNERLRQHALNGDSMARIAADKLREATRLIRLLESELERAFDALTDAQQACAAAGIQMLLEMTPQMGAAYRAHREATKETRPAASIDPMERIPAFLREVG